MQNSSKRESFFATEKHHVMYSKFWLLKHHSLYLPTHLDFFFKTIISIHRTLYLPAVIQKKLNYEIIEIEKLLLAYTSDTLLLFLLILNKEVFLTDVQNTEKSKR